MTLSTDVQSPSFIITDGIIARLKQVPTFQSVKRWAKTPAYRVQAKVEENQIPYLGCYLIEEMMSPDGDANHAEPRFVHTARIGFSIWIASNDDAAAKQNLDSAYWAIMNLLTNERWHTFPAVGNWNLGRPIRIESITRGAYKYRWGNKMITNETPIAELDMDLTIVHRTYWPPIIPDVLDRINVTVAYPWPYDPNVEEPFTVVYDLPIIGEFTVNDYSLLHLAFAQPPLNTFGGFVLYEASDQAAISETASDVYGGFVSNEALDHAASTGTVV
jgi:hypothetical protein